MHEKRRLTYFCALERPVFFLSTMQGSRFMVWLRVCEDEYEQRIGSISPFRRMVSTSGTCATISCTIPCAIAPAWPVMLPPQTIANMLNTLSIPVSLSGCTTRSQSAGMAKNLFSSTSLTKIVVVVTGMQEDAVGDSSNASSTTGARRSASEVCVNESVVAEGTGKACGLQTRITQTQSALSSRFLMAYEWP